MDTFAFELRIALRGLRRDWGYALAAIAMLALALALNATVFTVADAMLFRGFPVVKENDRLVYIQERCTTSAAAAAAPSSTGCGVSYSDFEEWRAQTRTFERLSFVGNRLIALRDADGHYADLSARIISVNTFQLLGVPPLLGRDFVDADEDDGAPQTAILSHRFWQRRYGARADIVGSTVQVNDVVTTIIAVMPERFDFPSETSLWIPLARSSDLRKRGTTAGSHMAVGRLRPGVAPAAALGELEAINSRLAVTYPDTNRHRVPVTFTRAQFISGPEAPMIWTWLWAGSWFVLLIACANLANLALVRATGRRREFVTAMALGAGQGRMLRRIGFESWLLTIVAAPLAWALTQWSVRAWSLATSSRYQVLDYAVNGRTGAYLTVAAATAAFLVSIAPMARVRQLCASGDFKGDSRGMTQSPWGRHLSSGLITVQMMLAMVLLAGAGLLVRSLTNIVTAESGVHDPQNVLVGMLRMPSQKYADTNGRLNYLDRAESELRTLPGIAAESVSNGIPVKFSGPRRAFEIDGRATNPDDTLSTISVTAGPEYFRLLGASPTAGRAFTAGDRASSPAVAIVNRSFADRFWPGESPLGKHLRFRDRDTTGEWRTVVGVVPNVREGDAVRQEFKPVVYTPFRQESPARAAFFLTRTVGDPTAIAPAVRRRLQDLDADVLLENFGTLKSSFAFDRDSMDFEHSELGKHATVAPIFAGMALLLSAIGLFAVIAHSIGQRTKEIGIRIAIGATARDVSRLIVGEGMRPVAIGLALGIAVALATNRILQSQLVGVSPFDPLVMLTALAVLMGVALAACALPLGRALSIQPLVALRED